MHSRLQRSPLFALLVLWLLPLLLAAPVSGQGLRKFDPGVELESWEHFNFPDHPALSVVLRDDMKEIAARGGQRITAEEREAFTKRWKELLPLFVERERRFEEDLEFRGQVLARYQVTKFRPFREIEPEIRDNEPPFLLVLQRTGDRRKDFTEHEIERYVVHGRDLLDQFNAKILFKLGRTLPPENATFVLAVLADEKRYMSYAGALGDLGLYWSRAHYDHVRRFAVTYPTRKNFDPEGYHALRHELVHAAMHAARTVKGDSQDIWLDEGLAEYLASGLARIQESSMAVEARNLIRAVGSDPESALMLLPIEDLVAVQSYADALMRIGRRQGGRMARTEVLSVFYREAHLFNQFLYEADDGRYRERYLKVIGSNFDGKGGPQAFHAAFEEVDLPALQREFLGWIDPTLASLELPPTPEVEEPVAVEAAATIAPCGVFDPEALRALVETPSAALGRALLACREGAAEDAADLLDRALERAEPGEDQKRLKRESARVRAWIDLRDRYLGFLAREGRKLDLEVEGKRVRAKVLSFEKGVVVLEPNGSDFERLGVDRLPAFALASAMGKHRKELEAGWVRIYPYALAGNSKWEALLRSGSEPGAVALKEDAPGFAAQIALGRAVEPLAALPERRAPESAAEARALLDELRAGLAAAGDRLPEGAREALRPMACNALETLYTEEDPFDGLAGEVERLGEGRVRVTYRFEGADELEDFLSGVRPVETLGEDQVEERLEVKDGGLVAGGIVSRAHRLRFGGPIRIAYSLTSNNQPSFVLIGACGREGVRLAACLGPGTLFVNDPRSGLAPQSPAADDLVWKGTRRVVLDFDGQGQVELSVDGKQVLDRSCGTLRILDVFLTVMTEAEVTLDDLVLEGIPDAEALEPLRRSAVARGLEALGM